MQQVQNPYHLSICNHLKYDNITPNLDSKQLVKDLGLFYEESSGINSYHGRLHHWSLDQSNKLPIPIPIKSYIAKLSITFAHEKCLLGGVKDTLVLIRQLY